MFASGEGPSEAQALPCEIYISTNQIWKLELDFLSPVFFFILINFLKQKYMHL